MEDCDILLLPAAFRIVTRSGTDSWSLGGVLLANTHDARRTLDFLLVWWEPRRRHLISQVPAAAGLDVAVRTRVAEGTAP